MQDVDESVLIGVDYQLQQVLEEWPGVLEVEPGIDGQDQLIDQIDDEIEQVELLEVFGEVLQVVLTNENPDARIQLLDVLGLDLALLVHAVVEVDERDCPQNVGVKLVDFVVNFDSDVERREVEENHDFGERKVFL